MDKIEESLRASVKTALEPIETIIRALGEFDKAVLKPVMSTYIEDSDPRGQEYQRCCFRAYDCINKFRDICADMHEYLPERDALVEYVIRRDTEIEMKAKLDAEKAARRKQK